MPSRRAGHGPQTPATTALRRLGVPFTAHVYSREPASDVGYGVEAAMALGVPAELVFKTLVVDLDGLPGSGLAVGIVPVTASLDLKALAHVLGAKRAAMAAPTAAERSTGYVMGGISPVGQRSALPTVLDASADALDVLYVSGGRRGFDIAMRPADLLAVTAGRSAAIAR